MASPATAPAPARTVWAADLKFQPCTQCNGRGTGGVPRAVFHYADRIVTRCKNAACNHIEEYRKG